MRGGGLPGVARFHFIGRAEGGQLATLRTLSGRLNRFRPALDALRLIVTDHRNGHEPGRPGLLSGTRFHFVGRAKGGEFPTLRTIPDGLDGLRPTLHTLPLTLRLDAIRSLQFIGPRFHFVGRADDAQLRIMRTIPDSLGVFGAVAGRPPSHHR